MKQGPKKDITSYVCRFKVVCIQYIGMLLDDQTNLYYFIQGFGRNTTRREVLTRRSNTLEVAIQVVVEVKVINKENGRMEKRFDDPILPFILLSQQSSEP